MARKHLDEIRGNEVPVYARDAYYQNNPYFDSTKYAKSDNKSTKKNNNNSYKPSKSTKRGDTVGAGEYAVSKGDSLWKIAQANGTTVEALRKSNPEIRGNMIYPGQIIKIGNSASADVSTVTSSPSKTEIKATPNKSATVRDTVVTNQVIDTTANRSLANAQSNTVSRRQTSNKANNRSLTSTLTTAVPLYLQSLSYNSSNPSRYTITPYGMPIDNESIKRRAYAPVEYIDPEIVAENNNQAQVFNLLSGAKGVKEAAKLTHKGVKAAKRQVAKRTISNSDQMVFDYTNDELERIGKRIIKKNIKKIGNFKPRVKSLKNSKPLPQTQPLSKKQINYISTLVNEGKTFRVSPDGTQIVTVL